MPPTVHQEQALRFLRDYIHVHRRSPSELEIAIHLGITPPSAHGLILRMERAGLVRRTPRTPRSLLPTTMDTVLEREAKAIVVLGFRNGPIEGLHAGRACPACAGKPEFSRISDEEMKTIMRAAVDRVFTLLAMKEERPADYDAMLQFAALQTRRWDPPARTTDL